MSTFKTNERLVASSKHVMVDYRLSVSQPFTRFLFKATDPRVLSGAVKVVCTGTYNPKTRTFTTDGDIKSVWYVHPLDWSMSLA